MRVEVIKTVGRTSAIEIATNILSEHYFNIPVCYCWNSREIMILLSSNKQISILW